MKRQRIIMCLFLLAVIVVGIVFAGTQFGVWMVSDEWDISPEWTIGGFDPDKPSYDHIGSNNSWGGQPTKLYTYWDARDDLSYWRVQHNNTGSLETIYGAFGATPSWSNYTLNSLNNSDCVIQWRQAANDTDNEWTATPWQNLSVSLSSGWWYFTLVHRDYDANLVSSAENVTWLLFNATQELDYVSGQTSLTDGTYTLKTYFHTYLVNTRSLSTTTYGNTTVTTTLSMKEVRDDVYFLFNTTASTITLQSTSSRNVTFTATGTGAITIYLETTHNVTYVRKANVVQSDWAYSAIHGLIIAESNSFSQWKFETHIYYFSFDFLDVDSLDVQSAITWKLYNSSQLLSYTEGTLAIMNGTYTLYTYRRGWLINTTTLATETVGNTTIDINLYMKATQFGYITFNYTIASITLNSNTAANITFTVTGSSPQLVLVDVPRNATYVEKDHSSNLTDWVYNVVYGYIYFNRPTLSTYEIIFPESLGLPYFTLALFFVAVYATGTGTAIAFWYRRNKKIRSRETP